MGFIVVPILTPHTSLLSLSLSLSLSLPTQSEVRRLGRRLSDEDLGDFMYAEPSELMATELAAGRRVKSEPAQRMLRPVVKVCSNKREYYHMHCRD